MSTTTKHEFLKQKAQNVRTLLNSYSPDPEVQTMLSGFNEMLLIPTITTVLIPLKKSGKLEATADQVMTKLKVPEDEKASVQTKQNKHSNHVEHRAQ